MTTEEALKTLRKYIAFKAWGEDKDADRADTALDTLRAQLERQEAACAHCAYCVMTQDASSVAPVVADGSATEERLEPEVSPRRSGPSNLARDAAGATPPNQEDGTWEAEVDALRNRLWQRAGIDFEKLRKDSGWPTPIAMRRAADGFDTIGVVARYGDVLRWVADACDGILSTPPNQGDQR